LNKYKPELVSPNLFKNISNTNEFKEIKQLVSGLQKINLNILPNDDYKTCFWLNIYNFLVIYAIIYKNEILTNFYEWYCFLKNSYFNIGGLEFNLYEIENCILQNNVVCMNNYGSVPKFADDDERIGLIINKIPKYTVYGISLPTISCPCLRIYFPNNLNSLLLFNAKEYVKKNIDLEIENSTLNVAEYINWVDTNIIDNISDYSELISPEFTEFINSNSKDLSKRIIKYVWFINFTNIV
jgi:hypothetical protein